MGKRGFAAATESREALQFDDFQDRVGFGEVVHAPPTIAFKNKKIDATAAEEINTAGGERKPGAKSGLLLAKKTERRRWRRGNKEKEADRQAVYGEAGDNGGGAAARGGRLQGNQGGKDDGSQMIVREPKF